MKNAYAASKGAFNDRQATASLRENRWCRRRSYFIDLIACEARAKTMRACGRCLAKWRQLSFSFMDS